VGLLKIYGILNLMSATQSEEIDYLIIEQAIQWLDLHAREDPIPGALAEALGLSASQVHQLFMRWARLSPKQFMEWLRGPSAKAWLDRSAPLLDAAFEVDVSGPEPLHDHRVQVEAMSPGEYKKGGAGVRIRYGVHPSPFGRCLLGVTSRGLSYFGFGEGLEEDLQTRWPGAELVEESSETHAILQEVFQPVPDRKPLRLHLRGTTFQVNVWDALLRIPAGAVISYGDLAKRMGKPAAARAVGAAVGTNPVACLIPCHRVLAASGAFHHYRWGSARKKAILIREFADRSFRSD
jgi:AraC family transcriptional regulator of adaptative response/methylated-DNA-[protein]-cysteine methyltransferase